MIRSRLLVLSACLIATQLAGCSSMESWRSSDRNLNDREESESRPFGSADIEIDDEDSENDDPMKFVGDDGRTDLALEGPLDPWFGKYNYADKGRAIKRSLGSGN